MPHSDVKNAPPLHGWAIAVAAGAVATAVSFLVVGIEGNGSVAVGAVITLVVGVIFTIAETPPARSTDKPTQHAVAKAAAPTPPKSDPVPAPAAPVTSQITATPTPEAEAEAGAQPQALAAPVGAADDLKQISGVGPVLERKLNDLGIYHFWQIAGWSADEVAWVDGFLNFKGRIDRDEWIVQANKLAATSPSKPPA
jgi:predicted flap endonuclease-1-like 5' DNA nuclease